VVREYGDWDFCCCYVWSPVVQGFHQREEFSFEDVVIALCFCERCGVVGYRVAHDFEGAGVDFSLL
jgi:hypothetical protein